MIVLNLAKRLFGSEDKQLKKLLKDISADQAEIFLKTVHPEIWEKLKESAASEAKIPSQALSIKRNHLRTAAIFAGVSSVIGLGAAIYYNSANCSNEDTSGQCSQKKDSNILANTSDQVSKDQKAIGTNNRSYPNTLKEGLLGEGPFKEGFNRITLTDVNVRALPTRQSKSLGIAKLGGCINVIEIVDGKWAHFRGQDTNGNITEGYMAGSRLTPLIGQTAKCTFEFEVK